MDKEQEKPKEKHSLGVIILSKRPEIAVIAKGGFFSKCCYW